MVSEVETRVAMWDHIKDLERMLKSNKTCLDLPLHYDEFLKAVTRFLEAEAPLREAYSQHIRRIITEDDRSGRHGLDQPPS